MPSNSQSPPSSIAARLDDSVFAIRKRVESTPRVGIVLGSGLGDFADTIAKLVKIPYRDVPHMADPEVAGHAGNFCFGEVDGTPVVCMQGRVHLYEGHPSDRVVHGVRTMARLGAQFVLLTNAAGGLEPAWAAGDLMVISDHVNLTGSSPLVGPEDESIGPRFPDMTERVRPRAARLAARRGAGRGHHAPRGRVRRGCSARSTRRPPRCGWCAALGAQAVGMSTVHEVIALRHMGVRVGALSCITNLAAGIAGKPLSHAEVEATARSRRAELVAILTGWIARAGAAP